MLASATIANPVELASGLVGSEFELVDSDGAPRAGRRIAICNPPLIDERTMRRRSVLSEAAELLADLVVTGSRTICFLQQPARDRADLALRADAPRGAGRAAAGGGSPPTAPATRRSSGARSRPRSRAASCSGWSPPTRSSSGSTSASSTRRSASPSRARSPACARCGGGRGGAARGFAVTSPATTRSTSSSAAIPEEFLDRPVEAAILDHTNERIHTAHLLAAAYEAPLGGTPEQPGGADDEILGRPWRERADPLVAAGQLRRGRDGRYLPRGPGYVVVTEHDVHQTRDGARGVGVLVVLDALDQGGRAVADSHDCYSNRTHRVSSSSFSLCRWFRRWWPAWLPGSAPSRRRGGCRRGRARVAAVVPAVRVRPAGGRHGRRSCARPLIRSVSQRTSRSTDSTPWRWSSLRSGRRPPCRLVLARSSRSWRRVRRPSRTRSRISMSVREKNANRMSKLSSSQAVGPTSVHQPPNLAVPAAVTW